MKIRRAGGGGGIAGKKAVAKHARKGLNLSRKSILQQRRENMVASRQKQELQKAIVKTEVSRRVTAAHNRRTHKAFDHNTLQCVQEGLVESIQLLGEAVSPLSLFMAASTALSRTPEKHHIPYIFAILSACTPRLSQGMLLHQLDSAIALTEQLIAENVSSNHLIVAKGMKFAQQLVLSIESPNMRVMDIFCRLEPSKLQVDCMKMYIVAFRKLIERAALCGTTIRPNRDPSTGVYILDESQTFFVHSFPRFVRLCVDNFSSAPVSVACVTTSEFIGLVQRTLSPYIVESLEGQKMIEAVVSDQLLELLKPLHQAYWGHALELLEALLDRVSYLKRTAGGDVVRLTERFPSFRFLLRVLNKLRAMDDAKLNGKVERVMVALGRGMSVQEFLEIVPFDPRQAYEAEIRGVGAEDGWANSYVLNVLRRIASHDSLPFVVEHFFPLIQFTRSVSLEYEKQQRMELSARWTALLQQYWRVVVGFCHYPRVITRESFRDVAKQLVGLLSNPLLVDTGATALHVLCSGYYELSTAAPLEDEDEDEDEDYFCSNEDDNNMNDNANDANKKNSGDNNNDAAAAAGDDDGYAGALSDVRLDEKRHRVAAAQGRRRTLRPKSSLNEDTYFLALNDPTWSCHVYHGITQAAARDVCVNIMAKFSANIMPKLCNTFETHDSTAVLLAIRSFSLVCTSDVMQVILKGILDLGANIVQQQQEPRDLAAGLRRVGHTPLTGKRRMVLDIACAVIAQIPAEHVVTLFNDIIEPVLLDPAPESRLLQKKAYKLLYAMFEHRIRDIFPLFPRIAGLLSVGRQHLTISGTKMRLRCLVWAIDACKMYHPEELLQMIRATVGEAIMLSRERSSETRTASMDLLEKMHRYLVGAGSPVNTLLHLVLAGFSGKTSWMVSSTLVAMAKLIHVTHNELPQDDLDASIALGFRMLESTSVEIRSAAAMFARMVMKLMKRCPRVASAVGQSLPKLLLAIALTTSQKGVSSNTRLHMRVLLEKCIKRFGFERLERIFPIGSKNFLRYTQNMMKREKKKEEREFKKRVDEKKSEFDRLFLGVAMKAGAEDDAERDLLGAGALTSFVSAHASPSFTAPGDDNDSGDELDRMHLDFRDGKLHIMSIEEKRKQDDLQRRQEMADRLLRRRRNGLLHADALNDGAVQMRTKRSRVEDEDFENEELLLRYNSTADNAAVQRMVAHSSSSASAAGMTKAPTASGSRVGLGVNQIERLRDQKREKRELKRARLEEDIRTGEEFKGKGEGDVWRGNMAPYAYIPLNRKYMNRRHQQEAMERLSVVSHRHLKGNKAKLAGSFKRKQKSGK